MKKEMFIVQSKKVYEGISKACFIDILYTVPLLPQHVVSTMPPSRLYFFSFRHIFSPFLREGYDKEPHFLSFFEQVIKEAKEEYPDRPLSVSIHIDYDEALTPISDALLFPNKHILPLEEAWQIGFLFPLERCTRMYKSTFQEFFDRRDKCAVFSFEVTDFKSGEPLPIYY